MCLRRAASPCVANLTEPVLAVDCPAPIPILSGALGPAIIGLEGQVSGCAGARCDLYGAQHALDGVMSGTTSLAMTRYMPSPWAQFKLNGSRSDVMMVSLWARADAYVVESSNLTVWLSNTTDFTKGTICDSGVSAATLGERLDFPCPVTNDTQYVTVQRTTPRGRLTIQEVEVYRQGKHIYIRKSNLLYRHLMHVNFMCTVC